MVRRFAPPVLNEGDKPAIVAAVDYSEFSPPEDLRHLVKVGWTLSVPVSEPRWVTHVATPDGCMEVIKRLEGRSRWMTEQPASFVAGMITSPASLQLSRGSRFLALRIWPWTWRAMSGRSPAELIDNWAELPSTMPLTASSSGLDDLFAGLRSIVTDAPARPVVEAVLLSRTCREASSRSGLSPRSLQRWFERHVGVSPRSYLRLLRFSEAFAHLPETDQSLAAHALDHGFADQAHMAREFRSLAGTPARKAKQQGQGPFIGRIV